MVEKRALILNLKDNVASVMEDVAPGDNVAVQGGKETRMLKAIEKIPFGFKMAATDIGRGEAVLKYGEVIGRASSDIKKGALVHIHNIEGARGRGDLQKGA